MEVNFISYIPAIIGIVSISIFVALNARNITNKVYAILNVFVALWLLFLFLADITHNTTSALWLLRLALFFGQLMFLLFYYFVLVFPYQTKVNIKRQIIYSLPMIIISVLLLTPIGLSSVKIASYGAEPQNVGFLYTFSDVVGILYMLLGIGILIKKYKRADLRQKKQIKFVLIGITIALVVNIFTGDVLTLLKVNTQYVDFGGFSLLVFSLFVAYAMIKHGFLDIRLIVARTMGYVLTLAALAAIYSVVLFGILSHLVNLRRVSTGQELLYVVMAVFLAFTFQPIKQFFDRLSNRIFYRDAYDTQFFLDEFNKVLISTYDMRLLLRRSATLIADTIKSSYCAFTILKTGNVAGQTIMTNQRLTLTEEATNLIKKALSTTEQSLIFVDTLDEKYVEVQKNLQHYNISVVAKVSSHTGDEAIGYLILGPKKSGNLYNSQDLGLVEIVANELVIAIQNALRFQEIENFNLTLQARIDDATKKLRQANDKLRALDETKDDFISMASHQLRTPLTSVKGYLSMVLDGDVGKVSKPQREMLGQAFFSSQRMVYLIADLLNVSRLKTGKFIIEPSPVDLAEIIDQELSQLGETASSKSLNINYDKPKSFPTLMLDETKTRQVIMNFVDNAIYYTPAGGKINVRLIDNPNIIELRIEDNGIGVPKAEQHHLFTKFYRAGNARKARPDGTGLGLFMAKKVVIAEGGSIIFESTEGKGSTFGFVFPKAKLTPKPGIMPVKEENKELAPV